MEKLLDIDELSQILGVKKSTVYNWISQNKIPHIKIGKRILKFRAKDIEAWIEAKSVNYSKPDFILNNEKRRNRTKVKSKPSDDYIENLINRAKASVIK